MPTRKKADPTAARLLKAVKAQPKSDAAWQALIEHHHHPCLRWAKTILRHAKAEEVVQDCYLKARGELRSIRNFRSWMLTAIRNHALNVRKRGSREELSEMAAPSLDEMVKMPQVDWEADDPHPQEDPRFAAEEGRPDQEEQETLPGGTLGEAEADRLHELLSRHRAELSGEEAWIADLHWGKEETYPQIAKRARMTEDEVRTILKRVRRKLDKLGGN